MKWKSDEILRLQTAVLAGQWSTDLLEAFPGRSQRVISKKMTAIRHQLGLPNASTSHGRGGRPRGSPTNTWTRWTDAERAVIVQEEAFGHTAQAILDAGLLPGRDHTSIQNQLSLLRSKHRGQCPKCRRPGFGARLCPECCEETRQDRKKAAREGRCVGCGEPRGTDGSLTLCKRCLDYRRPFNTAHLTLKRSDSSLAPTMGLFPWKSSRSRKALALVPPPGSTVVDLFGGASRLTQQILRAGHTVVAWNDIHPLAASYTYEVIHGDIEQLFKDIRRLLSQLRPLPKEQQLEVLRNRYEAARAAGFRADPLGPAIHYLWHNGAGQSRSNTKYERLAQETAGLFAGMQVTCADYREILRALDAPGVWFLCDPPWPNSEGIFEYHLDGRHADLFCDLLVARGEFALAIQSSDATLRALREAVTRTGLCMHTDRMHLYFQWTPLGHEIICTSRPPADPGNLRPFTLDQFGG